ncbi:IS21 family transposase (plasmid) [Lichenicola cladoniae]|uniref:IS21 family transposase n=1 Tax=Lichenicola cladoniae TaxID=1484109 RepID=A0A6M8HZ58_9PROT|nr:IS21 family transposase [Lichenicola cladoniae]QKE93813.1 IS21 family transposase [Lichenicola cladoniae]
MVRLGELVMILDLHRQGLSVSAIARRVGIDRKTVRKYIERGLEPPIYQARQPRPAKVAPFHSYLRERVAAYPDLTGSRLHREIRDLGYAGGYTAVKDFLRGVRPTTPAGFEVRFETPPGRQAQVDFAHFRTVFTDEPSVERVVWLFSLVLGHSRMLWGRFVPHQDLQTLLRCHAAAFEALHGAPTEILYDRMRTVFSREDPEAGHIVYNRTVVEFARHYGYLPKACQAYRAKTKGKVERPFRYIREDFFLSRSFRNLGDLNDQFRQWLDQVANARIHATTQRVVSEHFAEERPRLQPLPAGPFQAVLRLEWRITRDGMVSVDGNLYSVPDTTHRRPVEVHSTASEVRILEEGHVVATHPVLEGRGQRRIIAGHRSAPPPPNSQTPRNGPLPGRSGDVVALRPLTFYDAVGKRLAADGAAA